jgi:hypothetical protein
MWLHNVSPAHWISNRPTSSSGDLLSANGGDIIAHGATARTLDADDNVPEKNDMKTNRLLIPAVLASLVASSSVLSQGEQQEPPPMSFFITSVGLDGGNLGGLEGADAHCKALAESVGRSDATWRAYLSTQGPNAVNARDRIGGGPWHGAGGHLIARNLSHLHGDTLEEARLGSGLNSFHALTEKGDYLVGITARRLGQGDSVHDILTGSKPDGTAYTDDDDHTCSNWTSNSGGSAQIGHFDRMGSDNTSWNSSHGTRGCSKEELKPSGGAGLFYCFAVD